MSSALHYFADSVLYSLTVLFAKEHAQESM